jgi:hypothetical protein
MKRKSLYLFAGVAVAGVIAVVSVMVVRGHGANGSSGANSTRDGGVPSGASPAKVAQQVGSGSGALEGIAVHGHWTIEVRGTDGALVERREFENALTQVGAFELVAILSRSRGLPAWGIRLHTNLVDTGPCDTVLDGIGQDCVIMEASAGPGLTNVTNATVFKTLTVSPAALAQPLTLQGTAIATTNGPIDEVESLMCESIPPSVDPTACNSGPDKFTAKALVAPISVSTGQQILVTVAITFS